MLKKHNLLIFTCQSIQCYCSNTYGSYGFSSNCNMACSGNSNQICGGGLANSVYSTQCRKNFRSNRIFHLFVKGI